MNIIAYIAVGFAVLFTVFVVGTRIMMAARAMKLKGKPAPAVHGPSAKRISSGKKTILYFYTPVCGACRMMEPVFQKTPTHVMDSIFKIDASQNRETAAAYGVMGVPYFVFIDKGAIVKATVGVQNEKTLAGFVAG